MHANRTYVLDDHDKERQLDSESLLRIGRASDVVCADVSPHDLQDARLNVLIRNALDVSIAHCVPNGSEMRKVQRDKT